MSVGWTGSPAGVDDLRKNSPTASRLRLMSGPMNTCWRPQAPRRAGADDETAGGLTERGDEAVGDGPGR